MSISDAISGFLVERTSRRGFLARATMTATALSVAPVDLLLRPGSAYAAICECVPGSSCSCSDLCCDGYTQFCCTINNGVNACPPGTFAGGWWKADGSQYCAGPRYYIDCHGECHGCGCGGGHFCPTCDELACGCALGDCRNRHVGCTEFRYGQCHQEVACSGRIACRVVSCTPPWQLDSSCTTVAQYDENTANHFAPCQDGPTSAVAAYVGVAVTRSGAGYWLADAAGGVHTFGDAVFHGSAGLMSLNKPVVGMAATPTGRGYWLVAADGGVFTFGDAVFHGSAGNLRLAEPVVGMSDEPATGGYRLVAADGGVFDYNARFYGSTGNLRLAEPVVGMAATSTGRGYWLVAADGGVFAFGDAPFHGSLGSGRIPARASAMAATPTNRGYWILLENGTLHPFGDAHDYPMHP